MAEIWFKRSLSYIKGGFWDLNTANKQRNPSFLYTVWVRLVIGWQDEGSVLYTPNLKGYDGKPLLLVHGYLCFRNNTCLNEIKGLHELGEEFTLIFWFWSEGSTTGFPLIRSNKYLVFLLQSCSSYFSSWILFKDAIMLRNNLFIYYKNVDECILLYIHLVPYSFPALEFFIRDWNENLGKKCF